MQRIYWLQRLLCFDLMAIRCTHTQPPPTQGILQADHLL